MKRVLLLVMTASLILSMAACGGKQTGEEESTEEKPEVVTVGTYLNTEDGIEWVDVEVPYDPQRIAVIDYACLDIIDNLGLGDRVVGSAKSTTPTYLEQYDDESIINLGIVNQVDFEALMRCEPDLIFIGSRLSDSYDKFTEIAPTICVRTDFDIGLLASVERNATNIATIFGLEDTIPEIMTGFDERLAALREVANNADALVGIVTMASFNVLNNSTRCSLIGMEVGFNNLGAEIQPDTLTIHGFESSFELIADWNPEWIFVLDRDSAIKADGAQLAQDIMDNELVHRTDAWKNNQIIYLTPSIWYLTEGGITSLDIMITDLEASLFGK